MPVEFALPKLGPEMEGALLSEWLVAQGEHVEKGQPIAIVETEKVTTELESPATGLITGLASVSQEYPVGHVLATVVLASGDVNVEVPSGASQPGEEQATGTERRGGEPPTDPAMPGVEPARAAMTEKRRAEPRATPAARRLAKAQGIAIADLVSITSGGSIRKRHVEMLVNARAANGEATELEASPPPTRAPGQGVPLTPMRRRIALRMLSSLQETAQITDFRKHDVTELVELRAAGAQWEGVLGFRVSFTDLFVRAAALALREVPELNATLTPESTLVQHESVNIGIAVALPGGLMVPVLRDVDRLSLRTIHEQITDLVRHARAGSLTLDQLSEGTFTVTNVGSYGSQMATPILVQGQVGILATGAFIRAPVVRRDRIEVGTVMFTSLTVDHRVVDGETAGRFQTAVGTLLSSPTRLL